MGPESKLRLFSPCPVQPISKDLGTLNVGLAGLRAQKALARQLAVAWPPDCPGGGRVGLPAATHGPSGREKNVEPEVLEDHVPIKGALVQLFYFFSWGLDGVNIDCAQCRRVLVRRVVKS